MLCFAGWLEWGGGGGAFCKLLENFKLCGLALWHLFLNIFPPATVYSGIPICRIRPCAKLLKNSHLSVRRHKPGTTPNIPTPACRIKELSFLAFSPLSLPVFFLSPASEPRFVVFSLLLPCSAVPEKKETYSICENIGPCCKPTAATWSWSGSRLIEYEVKTVNTSLVVKQSKS